jgi:hypothetical protein
MAAVSEAMKRISDSWQAGSRRADQPPQPQAHGSEAAQVPAALSGVLFGCHELHLAIPRNSSIICAIVNWSHTAVQMVQHLATSQAAVH